LKIYYDTRAIADEIKVALDQIAERHGLADHWHPLLVCSAIEALGSPFKALAVHSVLGPALAKSGVDLVRASMPMKAVERLKSPSSQQVNRMMDAVAFAVASHKVPAAGDVLFRNSLRLFLAKPRLTMRTANGDASEVVRLRPSFLRAVEYLSEGEVIRKVEQGWVLAWDHRY